MDSIVAKVSKANSWQKAAAGIAASFAAWKWADGRYNISADLALVPKLKLIKGVLDVLKEPGACVAKQWYKTLKKPGQAAKAMLISADDGRVLTFGDVESLSNRVANWALSQGLGPGDVVALMLDNCPEYVPLWLGLSKVRVVAALINTNQKGKPLIHAVTVASSKVAIFGKEHAAVGEEVADELRKAGVGQLLSFARGGDAAKAPFCDASLDEILAAQPESAVDASLWLCTKVAAACTNIYTSGTTGLPKACKISHMRMINYGIMMALFDGTEHDIIYGSGMPMYHTAANLGILSALVHGCTCVIRSRFSASNHWEDCAKYKCTAMQYIGELCRYLLAAPHRPAEKTHCLRIAIGNGLRPELWNDFQQRFGIKEIGEFYGATEGNVAMFNHCKKYQGQGAVGRSGSLFLMAKPMHILKFDVENEEPIRNDRGFCIECPFDEAGELVAPIRKVQTADGEMDDFEGYTNKEATEKKVLRDVFVKGDSYFRTGDLIRRDSKGYYYFVDRIGDTFRWKGENVSTMEVSEVLSAYPAVVDANVYGAEVPGKDGRACMVALTVEGGAELDAQMFATYCRANLPAYAVPLFVRFLAEEINLTGTFKHQKVEYRNEGCDPDKVKDTMWWFNTSSGTYEPYGLEQYQSIAAGRSKL